MAAPVDRLVEELFAAFQAGDLERVGKCFHPEGRLSQRFGPSSHAEGKPWAEAKRDVENLYKFVGLPKYTDRRVSTWPTGFVEQHVSELKPPGSKKTLQLPVALVGRIDPSSGLIIHMEEYLDPTPLGMPSASKAGKPKSGTKTEPQKSGKVAAVDGAVAVISGASSGIGEAIALEHSRRGGRVVLTARRAAELKRVADACRAAGAPDVRTVAGDGREAAVAEATAAAAKELGGIDRLYVNAGVSQNCDFLEGDVQVVREMMEVNFMGAVHLTRACLPSLIERKGRIAAISSVQGRCPAPRNTGYSASKHAMHGFFESLRLEIAPNGVTVTMVLPGPVATDILSNLQGPQGSTVALKIDDVGMRNMTTAAEAGKLSVNALEAGDRDCIFPDPMKQLVALRMANPAKADALISAMYNTMEIREVAASASSKL